MKKYLLLIISVFIVYSGYATTRYVKQGASSTGSSWTNASGSIQNMITASSAGDSIFVAAGTYSGLITLKDGVHLFGSFPANNNSATFANRTLPGTKTNLTILDGNGTTRVIYQGAKFTNMTFVDGFVIQNGAAKSVPVGGDSTNLLLRSGGGAYLMANGIIRNCEIRRCEATCYGGGVYMDSAATIVSCFVHSNKGGSGSGVGGTKYSSLTNSTIVYNQANRQKAGAVRYAIGDAYPSYADPSMIEGIVCWVDPTSNGQRGWIIGLTSTSNGYSTTVNSPTATNFLPRTSAVFIDTAGISNTRKQRMVDLSGTARSMAVWKADSTNGWYIPAFGQAYQMFSEQARLNVTLAQYPGTSQLSSNDTYHTSTQNSSAENIKIIMSNGESTNTGRKNSSASVRYFKTFDLSTQ